MTVRIAMWSGPRNISTAMMRAFENRDDTVVVDEPFYAYYLQQTGLAHPLAQEVIRSQSTAWKTVAQSMSTGPVAAEIYYQKQMTHHILAEVDLSWTRQLQNCFLIRDPKYVVGSYTQKRGSVTQADIGIKRQYELFENISAITGQDIPVIEAKQFLINPEAGLRRLCDSLSIPFSSKMLSWPQGSRSTDGVWSSHWYGSVENSTRFAPYVEPEISLTVEQQRVADESQEYYQLMLEKCQSQPI
jgi:hypothetical protein